MEFVLVTPPQTVAAGQNRKVPVLNVSDTDNQITGLFFQSHLVILSNDTSRSSEAVAQMCSAKKMFLEISHKIHRKTPVLEYLF